ncbi:MAG: transglycosylase SLT domain-containing protein, partial [Clostridia bacterium]|nr:transglycosylase SLT domain-containing protein [Clostridia bacterium]
MKTKRKIIFKSAAVICSLLFVFTVTFFAQRIIYPLSDYKNEIISAAKRYDILPTLVFSIVKTESGFDPDAVSSKGAVGLMQLSESTA